MSNFPDPELLMRRLQEKFQAGQSKDAGNAMPEEVSEPDKKVLFSDEVKRLKECHELITTPAAHKVGDIVVWKRGLKNLNNPGYDRPALVVEVLKEPILASSKDMQVNEFSPHYLEPLTIKILVAVDDRSVLEFYVDGRRFEKAKK